jgi:hypothetical protein
MLRVLEGCNEIREPGVKRARRVSHPGTHRDSQTTMETQDRTSRICPIIVLGAERSGTSVVMEMVHRWGAYAGAPEDLTQADAHNPRGYWEYTALWEFLVTLGDLDKGASWWDASFQAHVRERLSIPPYKDKALRLVAAMETTGRPWVWKDPALSFYLPFWGEIWGEDAAYVITVRNPYDIARSWQQFVVPPQLEGSVCLIAGNLLRWQYMTLLILEHTERTDRKIYIPYEGLMQEPTQQAHRLYAFLNRSCATQDADVMRISQMAETVDPNLWHNQSQRPFSQAEEATGAQVELYQFLKGKVRNPLDTFDRLKYPMPPGWREFVENEEALVRAHVPPADAANGV